MTKEGRLLPKELEALQQRFQEHSRKAQAYYTVMHRARDITGSDNAASAWMENGLPAFGGKSPAMLVNEGHEEDLLTYISSLRPSSGK